MTQEEFKALDRDARSAVLKKEGVFLATRTQLSYRIYLFGLDHFFVELYVHALMHHTVWVEIQSNPRILNEYLEQIDLRDLF